MIAPQNENFVVVLSPEGVVETCNDACREATGLASDAICGKRLWKSLLPADQAGLAQDAFDRLRQGEAVARIEAPLWTKRGPGRKVAWTFTIVQRADGRLQSIIGNGVPEGDAGPDRERDAAGETALAALEASVREGRLPPLEVLESLMALQREGGRNPQSQDAWPATQRPFPYVQRIAPWGGGRLPSERAFFEVRCRDLSEDGFSFHMNRRPNFERLVAALGPAEGRIHVIAEVNQVHATRLRSRRDFLVECEFLARVYY